MEQTGLGRRCSRCGAVLLEVVGQESRISDALGNQAAFLLCQQCAIRIERQWQRGQAPDLVLEHLEQAVKHLAIAAHVARLAEADWVMGELSQQMEEAADEVTRTYQFAAQAPDLRRSSDHWGLQQSDGSW